jgi:hypothetical protein
MPRRPYDPLTCIPSPDILRDQLRETLTLAERLRVLLDVAERIHLPPAAADALTPLDERKEACRG